MGAPFRGFLAIELRLAENHSLKGKRMVVRSLKDRLRSRFNVAVAELDPLDEWHRAVLGIATISRERRSVEETLARALSFVEDAHLAEVTDSQQEIW